MAENVVLGSFGTLQNSSIIATLNANNAIITTAFADCLSLSGTQPNQMLANLDMNNQQIINLPAPATLNSPVRVGDLTVSTSSLSPALFAMLAGTNVFTGINTFSNTTQSVSVGTGAVLINGGLSIAKNIFIGGSLNIVGSFNTSILAGGINAASTLTLESTSNVSPSGDSISIQGSTIFFKSATGGTIFADYNSTTPTTFTFAENVTVNGNLSVTGSSSTFSFSGSNLGLGTATPVITAGFATLTTNGTTGGQVVFQTAGVSVSNIFNNGAANLTFNTISAAGIYKFFVNNSGTLVGDYNSTNANAWTFNKIIVTGTLTFGTLSVTGAAANLGITGSTLFGGTAVGSGLILQSTSNGSPAGDSTTLEGTTLFFKSATGATTFGDYNNTAASQWSFFNQTNVISAVGTASLRLYSNAASQLAIINFNETSATNKWQIGKNTNNHFILSDIVNGTITLDCTNSGTTIFNTPTTLQFQSNSVAIGDYALTTASRWTFSQAVNVTNSTASTNTVTGALVVTGGIGVAGNIFAGASINTTTQLISSVATGTAPLVVASTTVVANLNASSLNGSTFANPGPIGGGTPAAGTFTTLSANSAVTFTANTSSSSTVTGTLVVTGGVGISGALFAGTTLNAVTSIITPIHYGGSIAGSTNALISTSSGAPSGDSVSVQGSNIFFKSASGVTTFLDFNSTAANIWTYGSTTGVKISSSTVSSSITTGALVVTGGVGIGGNLTTTTVTTPEGYLWLNGTVGMSSATSFQPQLTVTNTTVDTSCPFMVVQKSRNGGAIGAADSLGGFIFKGFTNGAYQNAGFLSCTATGAAVGSNIPCDFSLSVSNTGTGPFEILRMVGASGVVKFTAATNFTPNGVVATTVTSLGPTGSHTTIQEWLTIQNASGVTRWIPCY